MKCPDKSVEKNVAKENLFMVYLRWSVSPEIPVFRNHNS